MIKPCIVHTKYYIHLSSILFHFTGHDKAMYCTYKVLYTSFISFISFYRTCSSHVLYIQSTIYIFHQFYFILQDMIKPCIVHTKYYIHLSSILFHFTGHDQAMYCTYKVLYTSFIDFISFYRTCSSHVLYIQSTIYISSILFHFTGHDKAMYCTYKVLYTSFISFISSPEPKARVSYCHSAPSVVRPSVVVRRP